MRLPFRSSEQRDALAAFAVLFGLVASHTVLETARDALFLARISPERLPLVTIAIAVLSLALMQVQGRLGAGMSRRAAVMLWVGLVSLVTGAFAVALPWTGEAGLYALYAWAGLATTLVAVHFWALLGDLFSVTQAKRLYGWIGGGSVLGAIAGSAVASGLSMILPAERLVAVAAGGFLLTTCAVPWLHDPGTRGAEGPTWSEAREPLLSLLRQPYIRRLAAFLSLSAAAFTVADYLFKRMAAETFAGSPEALSAFFGSTYLVLNVLSLLTQLGLVSFVLRRMELPSALAIVPALLFVGGGVFWLGLGATGSLAASLFLKGVDGALKHSLHRTTTELLYVPLSPTVRARVKALIDVGGQRGGQALASLAVLGLAASGAPLGWDAALLLALVGLWLIGTLDFRRLYLDLFRRRLRGTVELRPAFVELDLASLETLLRALDSELEDEVVAALRVFERNGWASTIPGLILHHPSPVVLEAALDVLAAVDRPAVRRRAEELLRHEQARVRLAAARALTSRPEHLARLEALLDDERAPEVRGSMLPFLAAAGRLPPGPTELALAELAEGSSAATRAVVAEAIGAARFAAPGLLERLADDPDVEVRAAAARGMGGLRAPSHVPVLLGLVGQDGTSAAARTALARYGEAAREPLRAALVDPSVPTAVRLRLPPTLADALPAPDATELLLALLPELEAGMVRGRAVEVLRELRRQHPELPLDRGRLERAIEDELSRAYRYLERRVRWTRVCERAGIDTPGRRLIEAALAERAQHTQDVLFGLLALRFPEESFTELGAGLGSAETEARSSALELLESLLPSRWRVPILALFDDRPERERLAAAGPYHRATALDHVACLEEMLASPSVVFQSLAAYHVGELGWTARYAARLTALAATGIDDARAALDDAAERAPSRAEVAHA
jgi:AAA family ATP:ADP antiporter